MPRELLFLMNFLQKGTDCHAADGWSKKSYLLLICEAQVPKQATVNSACMRQTQQ